MSHIAPLNLVLNLLRRPGLAQPIVFGFLVLLLAGCANREDAPQESSATIPEARPSVTLRLLVLDDPQLAAGIRRQAGEWNARTGGQLEVLEGTAAQLATDTSLSADAVVYPSRCLGQLIQEKRIAPLRTHVLGAEEYQASDIFDLVRLREIVWGETPMAVPLGSPVLVLYYRPDLLEHLGRQVPKTWPEYAELATALADRKQLGSLAPAADQPWYGAAEPLAPGCASRVLLARAAGYAQHPSHYSTLWNIESMEPLIAGPAFVRALEELVAVAKLQSNSTQPLDPAGARRAIQSGEAALALSWPTAADAGSAADAKKAQPIAFAELPGSTEVFDVGNQAWEAVESDGGRVTLLGISGRLGSLWATSKNAPAAMRLLAWLSGTEISDQIAPASTETTLFRHSQAGSPNQWVGSGVDRVAARQYAEVLSSSLSRPAHLLVPRIPGADDYLAALDAAVAAALAGTPSQEALDVAAKRWNEITDRVGRDSQRTAYRLSLGLEP